MKLFARGFIVIALALFLFGASTQVEQHTAAASSLHVAKATAAHCVGAKVHFGAYKFPAGVFLYPKKGSSFTTTSNCRNIGLMFSRISSGSVNVQVCFVQKKSCTAWKSYTRTNVWYTPAVNVPRGTRYSLGIFVRKTTILEGYTTV
jgi:hypothetical protein